MLYLLIDEHLYLLGVDSQLLEDEGCYVLGLRDYSFQYVCRFYNLLAVHLCGVHRLLNRLLCFDCKLLEIHIFILLLILSRQGVQGVQGVQDNTCSLG